MIRLSGYPDCCGALVLCGFDRRSVWDDQTTENKIRASINSVLPKPRSPEYKKNMLFSAILNEYQNPYIGPILVEMGFKLFSQGLGQHEYNIYLYAAHGSDILSFPVEKHQPKRGPDGRFIRTQVIDTRSEVGVHPRQRPTPIYPDVSRPRVYGIADNL